MFTLKSITVKVGASAICTLVLMSAAFARAEDRTPREFDIRPQSLAAALSEFARQANQEILFAPQLVVQKKFGGIRGKYPPLKALQEMLEGTGLRFATTPSGAILIQAPGSAAVEGASGRAEGPRGVWNRYLFAQAASNSAEPSQRSQDSQGSQEPAPQPLEEVVVSGYRASLAAAADIKRKNVNFTDSVVAEDIGKFPDNNLAEALNRVPGIQLSRFINGEGANISIRGLGPSFTQVLINGNPVAVASDVGGSNRAVDLDMFPVELFSNLTVSKTPLAHVQEGGIAGSVNIQNVRPFDNSEPGFHLAFSLRDQFSKSGESYSPRGAIIASQNWNDKFGILLGVAGQSLKWRTDGYENVGTDIVGIVDQQAALGQPVCPATICSLNTTASKPFHWASVVPPGISAEQAAAYGLGAAGTPYSYAGPGFTTAGGTSGLSIQDLSASIWPHLPRLEYRHGSSDRVSVLAALEYKPIDNLHFKLDMMYEESKKTHDLLDIQQFNRQSCNLAGTNGPTTNGVGGNNCQIPVNVVLDSDNILTSARILNSSYFLDNTTSRDDIDFVHISPSMEWQVNDWMTVNGSVYYDNSHMDRDLISLMFQTTAGSGLYTDYTVEPGSDFPTVQTNAPLNDANGGWQWYITRAQPVERKTYTKGTHWDAIFGGEKASVRVGIARDEQYRSIENFGATQRVGNCIAIGATATTPCTMPDGTDAPIGTPALIPNSSISQYLVPGPKDFLGQSDQAPGAYGAFLSGDLSALIRDSRILDFAQNRILVPLVAGGGTFEEKNDGIYVEANGTTEFLDRDLRFNAGVRYVRTDQILSAPLFLAGGVQEARTERTYDAVLPSLNVSLNVMDNLIVRLAGARTMTRANPQVMIPGTSFPTAAISPINSGNPDLQPYFSDNVDLGIEWYTGGAGVIALNGFSKDVSNFTAATARQTTFGSLGVPTSALTPTQLAEFNGNGGDNMIVTVNSQANLQQKLHIRGLEINVVQPLDFLLEGIGVTATYTRISQKVDAGLSANVAESIATGIAPKTYNLGAYYENHGASVRLTYNMTDKFISVSTPAYSGIPDPQYMDKYKQLDLSSSFTLPWFDGTVLEGAQITFDAINLTNEKQFAYVGKPNAVVFAYYAGPSYMLGFRGKF